MKFELWIIWTVTIYWLLVIKGTHALTNESSVSPRFGLIYYPLMPFISEKDLYVNNGIIRMMFSQAGLHCISPKTYSMWSASLNLKNRKKLNQVIEDPLTYPVGQGLLENVTDLTIWGPFNTHPVFGLAQFTVDRKLKHLPILTSERLVVVMQRSQITIQTKIVNGIFNAKEIISFSTIIAVVIGTLFWFVERSANPVFARPTGMGTGIYWSMVTMTTVGYGDITPVTFLGRILSLVWMVVGLMFASILTATLSESVTGVSSLHIDDHKVSVLNRSFEHNTVKEDYGATAIVYDSYEATIEAVRRGEVYAAVIPYEVAAWMQKVITEDNNPSKTALHMVYTLPGNVKFNIYISEEPFKSPHDNEELFECMARSVVLKAPVDLHNRNVFLETLVYPEMFGSENGTVYTVMIGVLFGVIALGLIMTAADVLQVNKSKHRQDQQDANRKKIEDTIRDLNSLLTQFYKDTNNMKKETDLLELQKMEVRSR